MAMGMFKLPQLSSVVYTHHLRPAAFLWSRKYLAVKRFVAVFKCYNMMNAHIMKLEASEAGCCVQSWIQCA